MSSLAQSSFDLIVFANQIHTSVYVKRYILYNGTGCPIVLRTCDDLRDIWFQLIGTINISLPRGGYIRYGIYLDTVKKIKSFSLNLQTRWNDSIVLYQNEVPTSRFFKELETSFWYIKFMVLSSPNGPPTSVQIRLNVMTCTTLNLNLNLRVLNISSIQN